MNTTQVLNKLYFQRRQKAIARYGTRAYSIQLKVMKKLLRKARNTEWGKEHNYDAIETYQQFTENIPVNTYEELKGYIHRMREGEKDVLWKGRVRWYAKSSGTTNDKSKFIPVSDDGLKKIHYMGGKDCVSCYLKINPKSNILRGKSLILGGSHTPNLNTPKSLVGDLSAILIENIPRVANLTRVPSKVIALMSDFEKKRDKIAKVAQDMNITNISGVPSWMLSVLNKVMELKGTDNLADV
ncbi:MAG: GH3 auxin-responsive promoter family protein, partial [Bacteroidaceae bacterium]|nr:GH3 auxin-responsive promoter family protein [Bacteroidaceae bacterium]